MKYLPDDIEPDSGLGVLHRLFVSTPATGQFPRLVDLCLFIAKLPRIPLVSYSGPDRLGLSSILRGHLGRNAPERCHSNARRHHFKVAIPFTMQCSDWA